MKRIHGILVGLAVLAWTVPAVATVPATPTDSSLESPRSLAFVEASTETAAATGTSVCGHVPALEAARDALRKGDRAGAVEYLRVARARLSACASPTVE